MQCACVFVCVCKVQEDQDSTPHACSHVFVVVVVVTEWTQASLLPPRRHADPPLLPRSTLSLFHESKERRDGVRLEPRREGVESERVSE